MYIYQASELFLKLGLQQYAILETALMTKIIITEGNEPYEEPYGLSNFRSARGIVWHYAK